MMFRSQTDEQLAAKWDPKPWVDADETGMLRSVTKTEREDAFESRVECIPSRDPLPWTCVALKHSSGLRSTDPDSEPPWDSCTWSFDPRPEFARPPVNRVLVAFRAEPQDVSSVLWWIGALDGQWRGYTPLEAITAATPDEIEHARKVLTRLAALA